jgi:hypothetical protein
MKKVKFLFVMLMVVLPFSMSARGGFHSSSHSSFHSSSRPSSFRSSGFLYKPRNNSSTIVRTVRPSTHMSPSVSKMTPKQTTFYHNNPSYTRVGNSYRPVYHYHPNYLFWYFIMRNNHTNRTDTIKAKTKQELDKKVKSIKGNW